MSVPRLTLLTSLFSWLYNGTAQPRMVVLTVGQRFKQLKHVIMPLKHFNEGYTLHSPKFYCFI